MVKSLNNILKCECIAHGVGAVRLLCMAEVLTMGPVFSFSSLLPQFINSFKLSSAEAGWLSGITFAGYALVVPVASALTDRMDARRVYVAGAILAGMSALLFAWFAHDFWSALVCRLLAGLGLAGTYMPGLKALVDRSDGPEQPKWMSWYTASFSLGTGTSFLATGLLADWLGWRAAFGVLGLGAMLAAVPVGLALRPQRPQTVLAGKLLDLRPVFANREVMAYVLGYFAHMWELFGLRSWMVAFLAFAAAGPAVLTPTLVAALSSVVAMIASIGGAAWASRFGRARSCMVFALASAICAVLVGLSAGWGLAAAVLMLFYNALVQLDSAALTTGAVLAAEPARRGASIAVHSLIGFGGAFLGPLAFGWVLDVAGGAGEATAWSWAFASLGAVAALGPLALYRLVRTRLN